jgi:hypothetical protein
LRLNVADLRLPWESDTLFQITVEQCRIGDNLRNVDRFKTVVRLVLLLVWLPATSHCYLEIAGFIPDDACCAQGESNPSGKSDPCDGCCKIVEKAGYKIHENQSLLPAPILFLAEFVKSPLPVLPEDRAAARIIAWPPDALHLPQFTARTGLPVRAPSFAS